MSWQWKASTGISNEPVAIEPVHESQERAEQWLTGFYDELGDEGFTHVWLFEGPRLVYGPMGLNE